MTGHAYELRRLADLMEAWDRFELGMQAPPPMHGNVEAPKLRVSAEYIGSLEALVRELATNAAGYMEASRVFDAAMKDGGNVHGAVSALYGYESMLEASLSRPLVSELTGEKEGVE